MMRLVDSMCVERAVRRFAEGRPPGTYKHGELGCAKADVMYKDFEVLTFKPH